MLLCRSEITRGVRDDVAWRCTVMLNVAIGLIYNLDGRILITQRGPTLSMAGFWEFPGGKLEPGETTEMALIREIKEEVNLEVLASDLILEIPDQQRVLSVFLITQFEGEASLQETQQDLRWVAPHSLAQYAFPPSNRLILNWIEEKVSNPR